MKGKISVLKNINNTENNNNIIYGRNGLSPQTDCFLDHFTSLTVFVRTMLCLRFFFNVLLYEPLEYNRYFYLVFWYLGFRSFKYLTSFSWENKYTPLLRVFAITEIDTFAWWWRYAILVFIVVVVSLPTCAATTTVISVQYFVCDIPWVLFCTIAVYNMIFFIRSLTFYQLQLLSIPVCFLLVYSI